MSKEVHRIYFCKDGAILDTQIREGEDVTDTLKRCFKKISDLETKLAESEEQIKTLEFMNKNLNHALKVAPNANAGQRARIAELTKENKSLKQQLTEKDKEIEQWKSMAERSSNLLDRYNRTGEIEDQDKISFAVEQLEQLKHYIWTDQQDDGWLDEQVDIYFLTETIDNQIKAIKGEEVEWKQEFGYIARIERLELPTWEEIKVDFIDNKRELGNYVVCEFDDCSIDIVVCCTGDIMISIYEINFYKALTKENYTLACRKAKELFLGEKK